MTKQTIEVEVPDGVRITEIKYINHPGLTLKQWIVNTEKIQSLKIVLERTGEVRQPKPGELYLMDGVIWQQHNSAQIACECEILLQVKEIDLSLTNEEPKLSLSVDEVKEMLSDNLWNPVLLDKFQKFIQDKQ